MPGQPGARDGAGVRPRADSQSMRLHGTNRVILMLHTDCGAYGGLAAFAATRGRRPNNWCGRSPWPRPRCERRSPEISVEGYFVDFEGVWDAEVDGPGDGAA